MTQFTDLGLAKPLLKALTDKGYTTPTPIQAQAIPTVLSGRDLLGIAQTGTGKTAAFALPILHRLAEDKKPAPRRGFRCLVLSPTRELATQIAESFRDYGKHMGLTVATIFGGVKYGPQMKALAAGVDVVVATPGRLMDHLGEKSAHLNGVEIFVLDEADQMLDLGFVVPIRKIASQLPKERQNLFFSATMPSEIGKLAGELLKNPAQVAITPSATTVERIDQSLIYIEAQRKRPLLAELLADKAVERSIVFTRTKRGADRVAKYLVASGIEAAAIHGDKTQGQRERALAAFKAGQVKALIATDIAARGIDVNDVSHVFNYELPNVPESYVHRIGRTARKGKEGVAISFCADDERPLLKDIQKATRQVIPTFDRRNDKNLAAAAAVADKLAPPEKYVDPRRADPRNNVPSELRRQRNRPAKGGGNGQAHGKPGGQPNRGRNGGGQGNGQAQAQGQARSGGGDFRGPKRAAAPSERWNPID
ncbi:RNA helicase [Caulobacter sp. Root1455]|uniref:DEAD/DEAH box helicase n=1 Tax=unclassified Caulobacter TaxID=2648921 RepID=UPI0006F7DA2D|nr:MULTISPECIES: DEAD/DEAH box helicase [unclassified Caulobacter]KQY28828.1 RNA helicase [Caulobacter sp. Root487D2Y]KQY98985.1 RNA helicase [Caulobacter sp. Root1455]